MLKEITEFSKMIASGAGEILLKGFRSGNINISYKSRTNLVTDMDKASEEYLFNKIKDKFPDHTIIAEEGSKRETDNEYVWYVDPLDATNNYAHGLPFFCVSIGVYSRKLKKVASGVVYDPYHNEMFSAVMNEGAYLNGKKINVSETDDIGISIVATGFPYLKEDPDKNNVKQFNKFLPNLQGIRRMGSAALDLAYLACGRIDGFWEPLLCPWDMAAGSILVEEAGGNVTKYNKDKFDPEYPEIVASNGKIHNRMISLLAEVL